MKLVKRLRSRKVALVLVAGSAALGPFAIAAVSASASGSARARPSRLAPRIPAGATAIGAVAASAPIDLSVALAPRDEAALASFIAATSTPGSAAYHRYLVRGQFASRFGPTATTIAAVRDELHSLGIADTTVSSDHLFVNAVTTASAVESAFRVQLQRYRLSDGAVGFSNTDGPLVSGVLASSAVNGILGMSSLARLRPLVAASPSRAAQAHLAGAGASRPSTSDAAAPQACTAAKDAATENDSYTDTQIAQAYKLSSLYADGVTGAKQTIALYELEPYLSSDLAAFQKCYGTSVKVTNINEYGGPGSGAGGGEAIMDLENIAALAPGAQVLVYQAPNDLSDSQSVDLYDDMVAPDNARQLSTSWGLCELDESASYIKSENPVFQEAAADGETFYSAAGDDGSEDCLEDGTSNASKLAVDDPGSQPYVVSVGGDRLESLTPTEVVWNDNSDGDGAGGGGISARWPMPTWQTGSGVVNKFSSHTICGSTSSAYCREVPDVSADADPDVGGWVIYYEGSWYGGQGGTSAAAPLWAALTAVINSDCKTGTVGFAAPALYHVAGEAGNFTDVTTGNNDYTGAHSGDYPATTAYDLASGLGSPLATGLANSLCLPIPKVSSLVPDAGSTAGGNTVVINGSGFASGASVKFGATASSSVTFVSSTQLKAVAPAHASGVVGVRVTTSAGTSASSSADFYAYGPPTISSFSPASGTTGATVTITGTNYVPDVTVKFGTLASSTVTFVSATEVKAVAPNGAVAGKISVSDNAGSGSSATNFTPTLAITGFSPSSGAVGTVVTITGVGFNSSSKAKFNGIAATTTFVSSSEVKATVPSGATTGPVTVTNTTAPTGTVQSRTSYTVT